MTFSVAAGAAVLGAAWVICALLLLRRPGRWAAGVLGVGGAVLLALSAHEAPSRPVACTIVLCAPLSYVAYAPSRRPRVGIAAAIVICLLGAATAVVDSESAALPYLVVGSAGVVMLDLWWRLENGEAPERVLLVWLVIGIGAAAVLCFLTAFGGPDTDGAPITALALPAVCMVIGLRRSDLVDGAGVVAEATVLGVTAIGCIALYVTAAAGVTLVTGTGPEVGIQALIATAVGAACYPLRRLLRSTVDELLFGSRPDPMAAAALVIRELHDPAAVLDRIRTAMLLPYAAIVEGTDVIVSGEPTPYTKAFTLSPDSDGRLIVGMRPGELHLPRTDAEVLALLARLVGQIRRAETLGAELAASRTAIRAAVEEERRRLQRELHDGVGPTLTGIALTTDAVGNLMTEPDERLRSLVGSLRAEAGRAIADLRRIVYDIRPPALDQVGLGPAIEQVAAGMRVASLTVTVTGAADLPDLPAAVEVATYRIVTEALTNVARHSRADHAQITLGIRADRLHLLVTDNGACGPQWVPGVGLRSIRERATELGGEVRFDGTRGGLLEASLPLHPV